MKINVGITRLFIISLLWLLLEGIFRKWLFPSLTTQLFAVKYVLFSLLYFTFFLYRPYIPKVKNTFQLIILLFVLWCLFQLVNNPLNAPLLVTTFGYINHLFFIPLVAIVPHYFDNIKKIESFIKILTWLSVPIFIIGIIQYFQPEDHFLNRLANEEQGRVNVSIYTRSNSIFTFVNVYNVYLIFTLSLITSFIFYLLKQGKRIIHYVVILLLGILNTIMTGSRLPTSLLIIIILLIMVYIFIQIQQLRKSLIVVIMAGFIASLVLYNFNSSFQTAVDAFVTRIEFTEAVAEKGIEGYGAKDRLIDRLTIFKFSKEAGLFGFGIGTTYQGTGFFLASKRNDIQFEEEGERIILELGIIGGVIIMLLRLFIFIYSLRVLFTTKNILYALLILPLTLYVLPPVFFLNNISFSYMDNFAYWFSFGLILAMKKIYDNTILTSTED